RVTPDAPGVEERQMFHDVPEDEQDTAIAGKVQDAVCPAGRSLTVRRNEEPSCQQYQKERPEEPLHATCEHLALRLHDGPTHPAVCPAFLHAASSSSKSRSRAATPVSRLNRD